MKKLVSGALAAAMCLSLSACGGGGGGGAAADIPEVDIPAINEINLGTDYKDLTAEIKVLTNRTDVVDTVYAGYVQKFNQMYPNITVKYDAVTDYEESLRLRLTTGDWGDLCFIPTAVQKSQLGDYFAPLGDFDTLDAIYNFVPDKAFNGTVYGLANGGVARGIIYNKRVWEQAGYSGDEDKLKADASLKPLPKTPDEFLDALQVIQDKTDAIPLYTNFAAGWPMGAWDDYIWGAATGDAEWHNEMPHTANLFADRGDGTGPYAVYRTLYEVVARKLIETDPMSTDWEGSKGMMNRGEIATMPLGSWAVVQIQQADENAADIGYMPFPITVNGKVYGGAGGNYCYAINNRASQDNQIAAMIYMKWLLEESTAFVDEQNIPALRSAPMPDVLADFEGLELVANAAPPEGEEDLFDNVNRQSECGINTDDYPDSQILEYALTGTMTIDQIMDEWNAKWTRAQEALEVEVRS